MTEPTHNPFDESHTGELLAGKPPEQFLWGGAGNGPRLDSAPRQSLTRQNLFQRLESVLHSEVRTLGAPRAALLAFGVALLAYNVLTLLKTAVRIQHANTLKKEQMEISPFYIAVEIRACYAGMILAMAVAMDEWQRYQSLNDKQLAKALLKLAANVDPKRFRSHPRKPKVKKKKGYATKLAVSSHVSTARLLTKGKKSP
jgi:hypothetical protein